MATAGPKVRRKWKPSLVAGIMTGVIGLLGVLLGGVVTVIVAKDQIESQAAFQVNQLESIEEQSRLEFLRANRLVAYTDVLEKYASLNNRLPQLRTPIIPNTDKAIEVRLDQVDDFFSDLTTARQVSTRTQLLAPNEIAGETRELNKSYNDYLLQVKKDLIARLDSGDADSYESDGELLDSLGVNGEKFDEWLMLVRADVGTDQ